MSSSNHPASLVIGRFLISAFGGALIGQWIFWPDHSPVALSVGMALIVVSWLVFQVLVLRIRVEKLEASLRSPEEVRR